MKQLVAALLMAAVAYAPDARAQEKPRVFPFPYERVDLENGFRAYLIKAGAPGQIAYVSIVRTGSRDEVEPGRSGFAHFFEHMMFRGTEKYPNYDAETTSMGAFRNASTWADQTAYYLVVNSEYLEKVIDIESDRFQNLKYSEADFRTEAGAILGEYQQGAREPQRWLNEKVRETVFKEHPYGHTVIGFEADVRAMPKAYDYSRSFYERFYRPENTVLVLAGDFDTEKAKGLIRKYYSGWKPGYKAPAIPDEPPQPEARERTVRYPGRTLPIISVNYRAPAWDAASRDGVALEVFGQVAFGPNSALYRKLVIEERRVQSLFAAFDRARDPYIVSIQAMVNDPKDVQAIEGEIRRTILAHQQKAIDQEQLLATKSNIKYGFLMGMETAQDVAFGVMQSIVNTGGIEAIEEYFDALDKVNASNVRDAGRRHLVETGRTTIIMVQEG
jgi:zinc protease